MGMIIQGSHLNYGFMQKLQAQKAQGKNLGGAASLVSGNAGSRLASGMNVGKAVSSLSGTKAERQTPLSAADFASQRPDSIGSSVANEIIRRMGDRTGENGEIKGASKLRDSLASALDWVRDQYGDDAGDAAAAMMMGATSGEVSEKTVGNGLLNTLKFIDRNFGTTAGDSAISKFNSGINEELNEFFDNGELETFHVAEQTSQTSGGQSVTARFFARAVQDAETGSADSTSLTEQLLEQLKDGLDETAGLNNLASQMDGVANPAMASMEKAMAAYTQYGAPAQPQFADMAV